MTTERSLKCLCCLKPMTADVRLPEDAVVFDATGNYGSTKFDCTGCTVRAIVCDECFEARLDCMVGFAERTERTTKWFTAREAVEETARDMFAEEEAGEA
jgi:hypothetical protein